MLVGPLRYQFAVAHVGFFHIFSGLDTHELCHQAVEDVFVVFGLVGVGVVE